MNDQLSMFAPVVPANVKEESTSLHSATTDVVRTVQHKEGPLRELCDGKPTGREFVLVELIDGSIVWQFADGTREPAPPACSTILIDDAVRYGTFVEVPA